MEWGALCFLSLRYASAKFLVCLLCFGQATEELGCRDEKQSKGKPGRKYQGEVIKFKRLLNFSVLKVYVATFTSIIS